MGNNFGVGLGGEFVALLDELLLQREVVLDNAVMNDDDLARAVAMRVRVFFAGAAMSGPAGVADTIGSVQRLAAYDVFEVAELAFCAPHLKALTVAGNRDSGRIVAAV